MSNMDRWTTFVRGVTLAIVWVGMPRCAPTHADDLPLAAPVETYSDFLNLDVGASSDRAVGYEQLPAVGGATEPLVDMETALAQADAESDSIVYLEGGPPPAYSFGYNTLSSAMTWLPRGNDRFGGFSYENFANHRMHDSIGLVSGFGVHFLDGPVRTDMPPRLFDFTIGVQDRRLIRPHIGYDLAVRVGVFSDFEGSAENGVRYPSHAVTFFRMTQNLELLLGVDYLDRDDISLLPVVGTIWRPMDWLRVEAVFPRPKVAARIMDTKQWIYLSGELGGGTWAIERTTLENDNATYRDLRLLLGWEAVGEEFSSSFEIGYVFDRELTYRSGAGDYEPEEGFLIRLTGRY